MHTVTMYRKLFAVTEKTHNLFVKFVFSTLSLSSKKNNVCCIFDVDIVLLLFITSYGNNYISLVDMIEEKQLCKLYLLLGLYINHRSC